MSNTRFNFYRIERGKNTFTPHPEPAQTSRFAITFRQNAKKNEDPSAIFCYSHSSVMNSCHSCTLHKTKIIIQTIDASGKRDDETKHVLMLNKKAYY